MEDIRDILAKCKDLNLLYIEDNEISRKSATAMFNEFFKNVYLAVDGLDGLEKFKQNDIDLIVTDLNMPNMSGFEMIKQIKKIDKDISILILTAHSEHNYLLESIKLNVDGYIIKPLEVYGFIDTLDRVVSNILLKRMNQTNLNFLNQYQEITDRSSIVSKTDPKGIITYVNKNFCNMSGYTKDELLGKNHNIVRHPDNPPKLFEELWNTIKDKKETWEGVIKNINKEGKSYYVKSTIRPILDNHGEIVEYIALRTDISDIMNHKRQLSDLVETFSNPIIVFIQIEDFSDIENFFGHKLSEQLQEEFSKHLFKFIPKEYDFSKIFILDKGKFALAKELPECEVKSSDIIERIKTYQDDIHDKKIKIFGLDYNISTSMSLAYGENALENASHGQKLLEQNKGNFLIANQLAKKEYDKASKNIEILQIIKNALNNQKIISYFQPLVDNQTKEIKKYESLVRLENEKGEILTPFSFLDIAKKGKYYTHITSVILDNSFEALKKTNKEISINISALDIENQTIREKIYSLLEENKDKASKIIFELLEDEDVKDFNIIKAFVRDVKRMGVRIAIDDFGTGYSNFERLLNYQPDILKIDGSLIKNIHKDKSALLTVKTIVSLAKELKIKTTAEFVENEEIFKVIVKLGVDYSQGYYFGKPTPL